MFGAFGLIGSTGADRRDHVDAPNSVADLMFTLMNLLGVDAEREYTTQFGSPTSAADDGKRIDGVV